MLSAWGTEAGITWHGRTGDIVGVWRAADIAAVPALDGDGMPRAMLEAAACGRPLVVSDVAGCRQFVRPGVEGLVVAPGDPAAFAEALARLAGDRTWRLEAGAAARRRVQHCSEDAVRATIRNVYRSAREPASFSCGRARQGDRRAARLKARMARGLPSSAVKASREESGPRGSSVVPASSCHAGLARQRESRYPGSRAAGPSPLGPGSRYFAAREIPG